MEAGEGGDSEITGLLDGNEDILEDAEKTTDPYTIIGNHFNIVLKSYGVEHLLL